MEFSVKREYFLYDGVLRSEGVQKFETVISSGGDGCVEFGWGNEVGDGESEKWECKWCLSVSPAKRHLHGFSLGGRIHRHSI